MIRKLLLGAGGLAVVAGTFVGVGPSVVAGATSPVTMTGPITCAAFGGGTFSMQLRNGGIQPTSLTLTVNLANCTGAGTAHGPVTVTGGQLVLTSATTIANNCGSIMAGEALPTMTGTVVWTTTGGTAVTTGVKVTTPYIYYRYNDNLLHIGLPSTITRGSYLGETPRFSHLTSNASGGQYTSQCDSTQPSGGLKTFFYGQTPGGLPGSVTIKAGV